MLFIKRLLFFVVIVLVIVLAIALSGLNTEKVTLNLYYFEFELSLGFLLIASLFTGLLIGLLMALFNFYMPLTSQVRKLSRENRQILADKRIELSND